MRVTTYALYVPAHVNVCVTPRGTGAGTGGGGVLGTKFMLFLILEKQH